jgi:hypothetical protein
MVNASVLLHIIRKTARFTDSGHTRLFSPQVVTDELTSHALRHILVPVMETPWLQELVFLCRTWNSFNSILREFMALDVLSLRDLVVRVDIS